MPTAPVPVPGAHAAPAPGGILDRATRLHSFEILIFAILALLLALCLAMAPLITEQSAAPAAAPSAAPAAPPAL